jgi:predicted phage terminase large subunit-like protein
MVLHNTTSETLTPATQREKAEAVKSFQRMRCMRNDLVRNSVLREGRFDLLMYELGYRVNAVHELLIEHQQEHGKTLQLAPRGCGKTTVGTVGSALVEILKDPNVRILFASDIVSHAQDFLDELKCCLTHPRLVEIFGEQKGEVWNEDEITVAGRTLPHKEKTVMTTGVDSSITSAHFDIIYCDDLVTLKNSRTEGVRSKGKQWFYMTLMPCVTDATTKIRILGTKYHPDDLYSHFLKNDPYFKDSAQIIPALRPDNDETNLPDSWTTEDLHKMRESMTRVYFNAQMNQDASGIQGYIFDDAHFRYVENFPKNLVVFTGVDLAIGKKKEHAKFAIVTIGIDRKTFNIYVLGYHTAKLTLKQQDEQIARHYGIYNPIAVGIESNGFQASKVQALKSEKQTSHIPAIPIPTDSDKITRAQKVAVRFERKEIYFHNSEKGGVLEEQLLFFPNGKYKDLVDALDIAIRTALRKKKKNKKRTNEPGLISPGGRSWRRRR